MNGNEMKRAMIWLLKSRISEVVECCKTYGENNETTKASALEAEGIIQALAVTHVLPINFLVSLMSDLIWLRIDKLKEHVEELSTIITDMKGE